jgi:transcriptional regulator with XRE-family HTH domain
MGKNRIPVEALREAIIYFVKERKVSVPMILRNVDISRSRLYDYLQGNGKVSATTLANILLTIGVSFDELMLHVYMSFPETIDPTVKDLSLASESRSALAPDEDTVYRVLSVFEETNDVNLLVQLVRTINSRVTDQDDRALLIGSVYPTVEKLLRKRKFYTATDTLLFANVMTMAPYKTAKSVAADIRDHAREVGKLEGYGIPEVRATAPDEARNYALIHINLLNMALENKDVETINEVMSYFENYKLVTSDFYFGVARKMAEVAKLIINDDVAGAKKLWKQTRDSIRLIIDEEFIPTFQVLTKATYAEFARPVEDYLR